MKTRFKIFLFLIALFTGISQLPAMETAASKLPGKPKAQVLTITDNGLINESKPLSLLQLILEKNSN